MRRTLFTIAAIGLLFGGAALVSSSADAARPVARTNIHQIGKAHHLQFAANYRGRGIRTDTDSRAPNEGAT